MLCHPQLFEDREKFQGGMELYENTLPLDDTVELDSPNAESKLLSTDMNTQVLDGCESAQQSCEPMEDILDIDVALDSDDEGENRNEAVNLVNEGSGTFGRFSGREAVGLLRRKQAPAGYFRRLNKVSEHGLKCHDSALSERSDEESVAGRTGICNDNRFQEHRVVMDSVVNLELHESKHMNMGKDTNYDREGAELNYFESPQVAESQEALRFVDEYLSGCDLRSYEDIPTRKTGMIKSPPTLRSKGSQCLARRLTMGSSGSKLTTFDWSEKQVVDKAECASLKPYKDSILVFRGDKPGSVSVNQELPNVNLHTEISSLKPEEKLPSLDNLDTVWLSSNDTEEIGLNSGICIIPDSMELEEDLDTGVLRPNMENVEQYRLTPNESYIGLDTQMAAEAMEELVHSGPPRVDACFTHQGLNNTLLDSSNVVNNKSESIVSNHEVAFLDWRCKEKRSKSIKISTVRDKSFCKPSAKRFKNQWGTVSQPLVGKKMITKKQKAADGKKISSSFHEGARREGINATCFKSNYGSSFEVKANAAKGKENCYLDVLDTNLSKLKPWVYPKRKRTRQSTPHITISPSTKCYPFAAVDLNLEKYPIVKPNEEEVVGRVAKNLLVYKPNEEEVVGRVAKKLLVYNRRRKVSLGIEHTGSSMQSTVGSCVNDSAHPDSYADKPLKKGGTPDDTSFNMKSDLLSNDSNGHSVTLKVLEGSEKRKQSLSPLSRPPLMKELMRLGYTDSLPDFLPKDSRRRRATDKVCILFSQNLDRSILKQQKKIVARLGFSIASCSSDATHFVADRFVRTRNMMEVIGLGKPVVTHLWLESCEQAGYVMDEKSYILRDEKKEKEIGFNMHVSLNHASQLPLLKGRRVVITPNVKPSVDVINSLVKTVQGKVVKHVPNAKRKDKWIHNDLLIISSQEDYTICLQFLQKGASIFDSELLLNGIITQKLEYERYRLFEDFKENGH